MAQYRIVGTYRIIDIQPDPDVVHAPDRIVPAASYSFSVETGEQLKQLIIANAAARVALTAGVATADQEIADQVDNP